MGKHSNRFIGAFLGFFLCSTVVQAKIDIDLLVHDATIVTMDAHRRVLLNGYVAITDGVILAVGDDPAVVSLLRPRKKIDARGKIVIPGLINGHTHAPMTLLRGIKDDEALMVWLTQYIWPAEKKFVTPEFVRTGTLLACLEMIESGTTTFVDMYFFEHDIAKATEACGLRAILGETLIDFPVPDNNDPDSELRWKKGISNATNFLRTWKNHPLIIPALAPHAPYTVSPAHLKEVKLLADRENALVVTHLSETEHEIDLINDTYGTNSTSAVQHFADSGLLFDKLIAAHVVATNKDDLDLLRTARAGVVHCPQSNLKLGSGIACVPGMRECDIPVGLGTDGAASNNSLDLWPEIKLAALLHKGIAQNPTVISAEEAFAMATIEGAKAIHLDHLIGSLEKGKAADLVILNTSSHAQSPMQVTAKNVYSRLVYSMTHSDVETVIVQGRPLMHRRKIRHLNEKQIRQDSVRIRKNVDAFIAANLK